MMAAFGGWEVNEKKKDLTKHLELSCTVCLYSHLFFTSKQIDLPKKKTKEGKKIMMWMLELFMEIDKLVLVMNIFKENI